MPFSSQASAVVMRGPLDPMVPEYMQVALSEPFVQGYDVDNDTKNSQDSGDPLQLETNHIVIGL